MKATGTSSTSFRIWLATFIPGLATTVTAFAQNSGGSKTAALGVGGLVVSLFSTLAKLGHDHGLNKATLAAGASDITAALAPDGQLRADLSKTVSFVENDLPGVKTVVSDVTARVEALEKKVPDLAGIEQIVRTVLSQVLGASMQAQTVTPIPTTLVPPAPPA